MADADEKAYQQFLEGLVTGNRTVCRDIFKGWVDDDRSMMWLYEDVIRRALYTIGDRWERGEISVATEHLATAIAESLLNLIYPRLFQRPSANRSVVVACSANEYHQIGGKMVADFFELHGWRSLFLGANTPMPDLLKNIGEQKPDALAFSLAVQFNFEVFLKQLRAVREAYPTLPILVGGQALSWGGGSRIEEIPNTHCLGSLVDLEKWICDHSR